MIDWIKSFVKWPTGGLKDGTIAWEWIKGSWVQILIFLLVVFVIFAIVKKILSALWGAIKD